MEFKLNEDQQMIHDLAKDFANLFCSPASTRSKPAR